jgi:signal transduction histidine kinase
MFLYSPVFYVTMRSAEDEREELYKRLERANEELNAVLKITSSAFSTLELDKLLDAILKSLLDTLRADAAVILLTENGMRVFASTGAEEEVKNKFSMLIGKGFAGRIAKTRKPMYVKDAQSDPRVTSPVIKKVGVRSMLGVPMVHVGDVVGVLHIDWLAVHPFSEREQHILEASAARCALAITNSKLYERTRELKQQAELYLDIMAHDINNLNQVALSNLELVKDYNNLTDEQRAAVKDALNAVMGSASIIDSVRKIRSIAEDKVLQPDDINNMIVACIDESPRPEGKNVAINYTPKKGLMVEGTPLMKDVFCNIINNSIKHSVGDVAVDVDVAEVDRAGKRFYDVSVADNGPGIPDDLKPKLFNRLERGTAKARGKGLGLFIAKSIVEQVGGDIRVEDRMPGDYAKGAKFIVSLPVCGECS